jgi:hypothetical protein
VPQDPTSNRSDIVPTFVGYSPSGNVTAETVRVAAPSFPFLCARSHRWNARYRRLDQVYANYGTVEDFAELEVGTHQSAIIQLSLAPNLILLPLLSSVSPHRGTTSA